MLASGGVAPTWLPVSENNCIQAVNSTPPYLYLEGSSFLSSIWASPASAVTQRLVLGALWLSRELYVNPRQEKQNQCSLETFSVASWERASELQRPRLELQTQEENPEPLKSPMPLYEFPLKSHVY